MAATLLCIITTKMGRRIRDKGTVVSWGQRNTAGKIVLMLWQNCETGSLNNTGPLGNDWIPAFPMFDYVILVC